MIGTDADEHGRAEKQKYRVLLESWRTLHNLTAC